MVRQNDRGDCFQDFEIQCNVPEISQAEWIYNNLTRFKSERPVFSWSQPDRTD